MIWANKRKRLQGKLSSVKHKANTDADFMDGENNRKTTAQDSGRNPVPLDKKILFGQDLSDVFGLINLVLHCGDFAYAGDTLLDIQAGIFHVIKTTFKRPNGLAETGTDLGQLLAAKDQKGNTKNNNKFRCS